MKNVLSAALIALATLTAVISSASAQQAGGPGSTGGASSGPSSGPSGPDGSGTLDWLVAYPGSNCTAGAACRPPRRIKPQIIVSDKCGCPTENFRTSLRIADVQDCLPAGRKFDCGNLLRAAR